MADINREGDFMSIWAVREKIYDATGEWVDSKEVARFVSEQKPQVKLKKNQALFLVYKPGVYDPRLAYPAAYGLSSREGV